VEYISHSEDNGEYSMVAELRRHASKFKNRIRDSKTWIARKATCPIIDCKHEITIGMITRGLEL
jgi:hypothetical protein